MIEKNLFVSNRGSAVPPVKNIETKQFSGTDSNCIRQKDLAVLRFINR